MPHSHFLGRSLLTLAQDGPPGLGEYRPGWYDVSWRRRASDRRQHPVCVRRAEPRFPGQCSSSDNTAAGEKRFMRETIRQVAVRRHPLRLAVLIEAGAGLGLAVGALMHRTTIVYPAAEQRTLVLPAMSRDAVGVRISRTW